MILLIITKTITITVPIAIITMKFLCKNATEQLSAFLALLLHLEKQPGVHREAHLQKKRKNIQQPNCRKKSGPVFCTQNWALLAKVKCLISSANK